MDRRVALAAGIALLVVAPAAAQDGEDEVVGGHTTYTAIEAETDRTVSVVGDVECHFEVIRIKIGVPPSVGDADADCSADVRIFGSSQAGPDPLDHDLVPTGRTLEAQGPNGETWTTTEHAFEVGGEEHRAWSVDPEPPRTDPETGEEYRFVMALPSDVPDGETLVLEPVASP